VVKIPIAYWIALIGSNFAVSNVPGKELFLSGEIATCSTGQTIPVKVLTALFF
jgi:hypothetical protein